MPVSSASKEATLYQRPAELLQNLIRFNTTNPPGNEAECVNYIDRLLTAAGFETTILARDPARPNLIARLAGQGKAPPLLLHGHIDVVTTENQKWQHPPFEGRISDGYIWGRGALDDKGGVAMSLAALLRAKAEALRPLGDVVLAIVSDEERGGDYGTKYLVENHANVFKGVRYALGEIGPLAFYFNQRKLYPIMVAEKQVCVIKATVRGQGGNPAVLIIRDGATAKLAKLLQLLDQRRLPVHITPAARNMLITISQAMPFPTSFVLRQLLKPALTDKLLDLLGNRTQILDPLLHNTISANVIRGGETNLIPSEITVELTAFMLPGYTPKDVTTELRQIVGSEVELEVVRSAFVEPHTPEPDMGLFSTLAGILREADPAGIPVPILTHWSSDARFLAQLGIQTYSFQPMNLPKGLESFDFSRVDHAADERVPVEALAFGADAIYRVLQSGVWSTS